jgi:hypothetical protein
VPNEGTSRVSKEGTESGIRLGRGRGEAVTTMVKVAGVSTSRADRVVSCWWFAVCSCVSIVRFMEPFESRGELEVARRTRLERILPQPKFLSFLLLLAS